MLFNNNKLYILMSKKKDTSSQNLETNNLSALLSKYLEIYSNNLNKFAKNSQPEFEVRFGTKQIKSITSIDFYNVIKILLNYDFKLHSENYVLKVITDSDIKTEINGLPNIQSYCKLNNLSGIPDENNITYIEKKYFVNKDKSLPPLDYDDYNFRISFQTETYYEKTESKVQELNEKWTNLKKIFRYLKRFEYRNDKLPFIVHCSIVKSSKSSHGKLIPEFNIDDSDVFNCIENFEIEIELNNKQIQEERLSNDKVLPMLKNVIKYVLIGLQESNYPISISEQNKVLHNYLQLIKNTEYNKSMKPTNKDFIGPSSNTLQMINLLPESEINDTNVSIPNIRKNYTVTEKADGIRKLLFISNDGKMYFIAMNMSLQFTGCINENKELFNTIIDGEHILHNKRGNYINLFACFDIYFLKSKNLTGLPFINIESKDKEEEKQNENYRLAILNTIIKQLKLISVSGSDKEVSLNIEIKKFYSTNKFSGCKIIIDRINAGLFDYNTDGLIFTPSNTGVSSNKVGIIAPNYKHTWNESFKWKPSKFNTIDFLVKFKRNELNEKLVNNIYNDGSNLQSNIQVKSYYTLILYVGFDEKKHGYINPCNDIINDNIKKHQHKLYDSYKPAKFYPTNPSDESAHICNIIGKLDESNNLKILTEEGDEIEDNTIVEFSYDSEKPEFWRWQPLRVRNDKTSELRSGIKNFGNAYHVANSNWQSIHNPITEDIITTGNNVLVENNDDDVYYNKISNKSETRALRDFHNLFVKNILIEKLSKPGFSLIDYAVGKGGDIPKWINAKLEFVLGIDLSKDNIENRLDGACARYLNYSQKFTQLPKVVFLNGDSSKNIKSGESFMNKKNSEIIKAIFGEGPKNEIMLGKGIYKNYGIAKNGFNISSIQFGLHYMFENKMVLNNFLKNLAECTALNGYFIGTCYDGNKIFQLLNKIDNGGSRTIFRNDKKIWEITKRYENQEFIADESSLGLAIDVYQETINKVFREYLVNFKFLERLLENYGFVLLNRDEIEQIGLPNSIGNFKEMYTFMNSIIDKNKSFKNKVGMALEMSDEEKEISYLNKFFVFKKVRNSDADMESINFEPDKQELIKSKISSKIKSIDDEVSKIEKQTIEEKSKKMMQDYIKEKGESDILKDQLDKKDKIKLSISEKIKSFKQKEKSDKSKYKT